MAKVFDSLWAPNGQTVPDILYKLVNSKTLTRLKWIGQNGGLNYAPSPQGIVSKTSRYDHSVGAMILTLQVGGTVDEAIAALLHDVIHTAFSHVIDFVVGSAGVSYHENHKDRLLEQFQDELKSLLGDNWKDYLNESLWPLIKANNPFAIDIADYTARDAVVFGFCDVETVRKMSKKLQVDNSRHLVTVDKETSEWWSNLASVVNKEVYTAPWNFAMNHCLAMALKDSIASSTVLMSDLETVNDSKTEQNAYDCVMKTEFGKLFLNINNLEWKFVVDSDDIGLWTVLGLFDIRHRPVNPPMLNDKVIKNTTVMNKGFLIYKSKDY